MKLKPLAAYAILLVSSINRGAAQEVFAVASIRPTDPNNPPFRPRTEPTDFYRRGSLQELICMAYGVDKLQIIGGPKWLGTERYDVEAKTESPAKIKETLQMLRSLLRDRFDLQLQTSSQAMSVYVLTVANKRDKLHEAAEDTPRDGIGAIQVGNSDVRGRGVTMHLLAKYLTLELDRLVIDETELNGHYDFTVPFDDVKLTEGSIERVGSLVNAIKDLGLRLQSKRETVPVLIIDSAIPPSAN
jgi:uncharacterized protein (TIGR03435 family)